MSEILDYISERNPEALYPTGLEDAIIGVSEGIVHDSLIVLDHAKCVKIFMERDGMTYEDAVKTMIDNNQDMDFSIPIFL